MLFPHLKNFNLRQWIDENRGDWVGGRTRVIWDNSDYITFIISGPTTWTWFHINPGDEIFYQLDGELYFHYITSDGNREVMIVKPGEVFLLPAGVPHSPRRPDGSWTLVVNLKRRPEEVDQFVWFCERCNNKVYQTWRKGGPSDTVDQVLEEAHRTLRSDEKLRTCNNCDEMISVPE